MTCIKSDIIQKYIDGAATLEEVAWVEEHIRFCKSCAVKVENQRRLAGDIKESLNLLVKDAVKIPPFISPMKTTTKRIITVKRVIYSISAACLVFLVMVVFHAKKTTDNKAQITIIHSLGQDIDANRPVTDQPIIINVIDSKGNISEYDLK